MHIQNSEQAWPWLGHVSDSHVVYGVSANVGAWMQLLGVDTVNVHLSIKDIGYDIKSVIC